LREAHRWGISGPVRRSGRETGVKKLYLKLVSTDAKWEELEIEPLWSS
jgi:hypothetical protein